MNLSTAITLAHKAHADQMYGDKPYTWHLRQVANLVGERGGNEDALIAAWLHDILEDTPTSIMDLLHASFSKNAIAAVVLMTKHDNIMYSTYISRILDHPLAREVKACDTMCNLTQSFLDGNDKRIKKYSKQLKNLVY